MGATATPALSSGGPPAGRCTTHPSLLLSMTSEAGITYTSGCFQQEKLQIVSPPRTHTMLPFR